MSYITKEEVTLEHVISSSKNNRFPEGTQYHTVSVTGGPGHDITWYDFPLEILEVDPSNVQEVHEYSITLDIPSADLRERMIWFQDNGYNDVNISEAKTQLPHTYTFNYSYPSIESIITDLLRDPDKKGIIIPMNVKLSQLKNKYCRDLVPAKNIEIPRLFDAYYDFENCYIENDYSYIYTLDSPHVMGGDNMWSIHRVVAIDELKPVNFKGLFLSNDDRDRLFNLKSHHNK
jgi:hypothetical protein